MNTYDFLPVTTDELAAQYSRLLSHAFARTEAEAAGWIERSGRTGTRLLLDHGRALAGLIQLPMAQFFGGRSVPLIGIAAVGTAPEARGRGTATEMMRRCVLDMRDQGAPLSGLYPATQRLYRQVGYEQSGHRFEIKIPVDRIGIKDNGLPVRPMVDADRSTVRELYRSIAMWCDGNLDRTPTIWDRIERPPPSRVDPARAFVVEADGRIEGYVFLTQVFPAIPNRGKHELVVHDMAATTPRASRRLWSFLASYATLAPVMTWYAGPTHPMLTILAEQPFRAENFMQWMTRIIDVPKALEARGYAEGLRSHLAFDISDDIIAENRGTFTLEVQDGRGNVSRSSSTKAPTIRATINGLAMLYTGYMAPALMRSAGFIEGDDAVIQRAAGIFAGTTPWMTDMY